MIVQAGPGECQPEGVLPGVSHRFADPPLTEVVIPGLNGLLLKDVVPVALAVMSEILTVIGVQGTFGFQEPTAATVIDGETKLNATDPKGITRIPSMRSDLSETPNSILLRW